MITALWGAVNCGSVATEPTYSPDLPAIPDGKPADIPGTPPLPDTSFEPTEDASVSIDTFDTHVSMLDTQEDTAVADTLIPDSEVSDVLSEVDGGPCIEGELCTLKTKPFCSEGRCDADGNCIATPIPGCCYKDADCIQQPTGPCEQVRCASNECTVIAVPGCCQGLDDCGVELPCANATCEDNGTCSYCPSDCLCTANPTVYSNSFDKNLITQTGFSSTDYNSKDKVKWQVTTSRYLIGPKALYMGDPDCKTYYTGLLTEDCEPVTDGLDATPVKLFLYSPTINLKTNVGSSGSMVVFWLWSDVEPNLGLNEVEPDILQVSVHMLDGTNVSWPIASSLDVGKNTNGEWRLLGFDLTPYSGSVVRLKMLFDTYDGQLNHYEGLYIDEYQIIDKCDGGCCKEDLDCPAATHPCMEAKCVPLKEGHTAVCVNVPIDPTSPCLSCTTAKDCDDGNPCTSDICSDSGICETTPFCCFENTLYSSDFEAGIFDWLESSSEPAVMWQTTTTQAFSDNQSVWFGNLLTGNYEGQGATSGQLTSPEVTLPTNFVDGGHLEVAFQLFLETEWSGVTYDNPAGLDRLQLFIVDDKEKEIELWSSDLIGGTTGNSWLPITLDITKWAGKSVRLRFKFDTVDGSANQFAGPFIDDFMLSRSCN